MILRKFFNSNIRHLNSIEINKKNILNNINHLKSLQKGSEIFPVLKSNAYGHGIKNIAKILNKTDINYICVNSFLEYQTLKKITNKNIILIGECKKENYKKCNFSITSFCVYNYETIKYLKGLNKKIKIHLFLNTGMNREGITIETIDGILDLIKNSMLEIEGVCSHFSSADEIDFSYSQKQICEFKKIYEIIQNNGFAPKFRHIGASAGILKMQDNFFNSYRPGLIFYGYNPLEKQDEFYKNGENLKGAFEVFSQIISIQKIKKGEGVSYNKTFKAKKDIKIAIIPFGYFEGIKRILSNNWQFKINGEYYNQVGNICMNLCAIDIESKDFEIGEKVQIISSNKKDKNNIYEMAKKSQTIPREVLIGFEREIYKKIV